MPLSSDAPLVLAHANFLDNLIADRVLESAAGFASIWVIAIMLALIVGIAVTGLRAIAGLAVTVATVGLYWFVACAWFKSSDAWMPLAAPTAAAALSFVAGGVVNLWARDADEKLRAAFERYVAPHILDKNPRAPRGRRHPRPLADLTLLFSDIKGYTTLSNTLPPEAIVELLCTYLDAMVDILLDARRHRRQDHGRRHHGVLRRSVPDRITRCAA